MANTAYLKKVVQPYVLDWLAKRLGTELTPAAVLVGYDSEGEPRRHKFSGVSPDGSIGVSISASSSYKSGQMRVYFMEATLLNRCPQFRRRIMVFTNKACWQGFKDQCDGLVDLNTIEPVICDELPAEMEKRIQEVYAASAKEVGDKSGPGVRVPGRRQ